MVNWFRLIAASSLAVIPTTAPAELLKFQCSFYSEFPIGVTVDDQARTVSAEGNSHDLGGGGFKVLKITKDGIWLIAHGTDTDEESLKITLLQRSGDPKKGGVLRTTVIGDGGEPSLVAPPAGVCWEPGP
ncbi:hypothetical protein FHS21_004182 [Phyllobacterium trifolii]|uniref:Uncharacterized protein n=1 Tax=Phyllobacterium trifolii TaxID=300193 RepID=A0A839UFY0_9HYPH|nr:hypothetical protein [Phyllobacterium trifolii]MBB3147750.1 hypothetical protein [Phyllobacterium trifolii]